MSRLIIKIEETTLQKSGYFFYLLDVLYRKQKEKLKIFNILLNMKYFKHEKTKQTNQ